MPSRVFVGNLPYEATEGEIRDHFAGVAPVSRVFMPLDRETGKPRGFAFVEFVGADDAALAIQKLHQKPFLDRPLVVNEARPSEGRASGGVRPGGPSRGSSAPFRPQSRPGSGGPPPPAGDAPRNATPSRSRRRGGKRAPWEEAPKKEPIQEVRRAQMFGGNDVDDEDEEEVEFENFATSLPEEDDEE